MMFLLLSACAEKHTDTSVVEDVSVVDPSQQGDWKVATDTEMTRNRHDQELVL